MISSGESVFNPIDSFFDIQTQCLFLSDEHGGRDLNYACSSTQRRSF